MAISKLQARFRLTRRFRLDGAPGDAVLLEFVPELNDPRMQEWAPTQTGSTTGPQPLALQIPVREEIAKDAFAVGEVYTLTIERAGRGT